LRSAALVATSVPDTDRSMTASDLAAAWTALPQAPPPRAVIEDVDDALDRALALAESEGGPLVVAGSLYLVGHVRARLVGETDD